MGKRGKKARAGKFTRKEIAKRLDTLVEKFEEELKSGNLFAPLPSTEVCPVCLLFLSRIPNQSVYHPCCGNFICLACVKERDGFIETQNDICDTCPFCREAKPSAEGGLRQLEARIQQNDVNALAVLVTICGMANKECPKTNLKHSTTGFVPPNLALLKHAVSLFFCVREMLQWPLWTRRGPLYLNKSVQ